MMLFCKQLYLNMHKNPTTAMKHGNSESWKRMYDVGVKNMNIIIGSKFNPKGSLQPQAEKFQCHK